MIQTALAADGQNLCFATVVVVDKDGNPVFCAEIEVSAAVEDNARLQAFGSAHPITEEHYTTARK